MESTVPITEAPSGRLSAPWAALLLLTGCHRHVGEHHGRWLGGWWPWLGLGGLAWGVALAGSWELAWRIFPRWWPAGSSLPLMPALAVLGLMLLTPLRRPMTSLIELASRPGPPDHGLLAAATVALLALGLLNVVPWHREALWLPIWLAWIRPLEEARVLLLMPMWGSWAMMVPAHFCPPREEACALVRAHLRRQSVAGTAGWMAIALAGTLWELNFLWGWVALPAVAALLAGSVAGVLICRRTGGASLCSLRAANALTQLVFLAGYLVAKSNTW